MVEKDLLLSASFKLKSYEVNIVVSGNGKATGEGSYEHGTNHVVFAEASPDHEFLGWWEGGELVHAGEVYSFTNLGARTLESRFGLKQHSLDLKVGTGGTVTGGGTYGHGSLVTIRAEAAPGYEFIRWSGFGHNGGEASSMEILVDQDISLVAELNGQLSLSAGEGGQVSGGGSYPVGSSAIISAKADAGYLFNGWSGAGVLNPSYSSTEVNMSEAREIVASFTSKPEETFILTVESLPFVGGTTQVTQFGNEVTVVATAAAGYTFNGWSGAGLDGRTEERLSLSLTSDLSIEALFKEQTKQINLVSGSGGSVTGAGEYQYGLFVEIGAEAKAGYRFVEWVGEGLSSPGLSKQTIRVTRDLSLEARFEELAGEKRTLSISSSVGGSVQGGGSYAKGSVVNVIAQAETGYEFIEWTGDGLLGENNTSTIEVDLSESRSLTASFKLKSYEVNIVMSGNGKATGEGSYEHGTNHVVFAEASPDHEFLGWWEGGELVHAGEVYSFTNLGARTLESRFGLKQHTLEPSEELAGEKRTLSISSSVGGSVQGGGSYAKGSVVNVKARRNGV